MNLSFFQEHKTRIKIGCLITAALIALWFSPSRQQTLFEQVLDQGVLQVGTRLGPLTYYERDDVPGGLDYNILSAFAQELGVSLEFEVYDDISEQLKALNSNRIQIGASTLSVTKERLQNYQFSQPYMEVDTVLIQHTDHPRPKNLEQVIEEGRSITVITGSAHAELLRKLKEEHPDLTWEENPEVIMFQLMERVETQEIDMAVLDSSIFDLEGSLFPHVEVALTLQRGEPIAFAFAQNKDNTLVDAMDSFLDQYIRSEALDDLLAAYLDPEPSIDLAGSKLFNRRIDERLPQYEEAFKAIAKEYDYNWVLLAAQAYQESHWNAKARSPTGVRGLMMLTLPTAKQLGVENRLDPMQSLDGGMRYLMSLKDRIPDRIKEPDRTKFALAAYNVGYGHLQDARILADRDGANPDLWLDVKKYLPLLRQKKYYSTVKHGYARGTEPVHYVNTIYRYANVLELYAWQKEMHEETMYVEVIEEQEESEIEEVLELSPSAL